MILQSGRGEYSCHCCISVALAVSCLEHPLAKSSVRSLSFLKKRKKICYHPSRVVNLLGVFVGKFIREWMNAENQYYIVLSTFLGNVRVDRFSEMIILKEIMNFLNDRFRKNDV